MRPPIVAIATFLLIAPSAWAAPPANLSARIDEHLAAGWTKAGVTPASAADDSVFLRRVTLDLVGRIPTLAEARAFADDPRADKRERLVDRLVGSAAHARHSATFWRRTWVPQADAQQFLGLADDYEAWLTARLTEGAPLDVLVREQLTANLGGRRGDARNGLPVSTAFLVASEGKPENLAANTTRAFLGVNLDCAQCHDHPFARWTRDQFWETAAFFAPPMAAGEGKPVRLEIAIPQTNRVVGPKLLTAGELTWPTKLEPETGRHQLAEWIANKDNPYFARNAVNRIWANYMGPGLVEPLDDLSGDNAPSHPALFDELAKAFVQADHDPRVITKAIVLSRAYGLATTSAEEKESTKRLYARMATRGLTGEQLYDSLRVAAGLPPERDDLDPVNARAERKRFAGRFRVERAANAQRSILQSLAMMNGKLTATLTDAEKSPTLAGIADAPFLDLAGKIDALFLATLGRKPTVEESSIMQRHVVGRGADPRKGLSDVFWVLLNSSEFNTNH